MSGLLGLAFSTIANSGAQTFWEASESIWDEPVMGFAFSRFTNVTDAESKLVAIQLLTTLTRVARS